MAYILVDRTGTVLARSASRRFLKRKQRQYRKKTLITAEKSLKKHLKRVGKEPEKMQKYQPKHPPKQQTQSAQQLVQRLKAKAHPKPTQTTQQIGGTPRLRSSVVEYLAYYPRKQIVDVRLGGPGRYYGSGDYHYLNVPPSVFDRWWEGQASCKTTDPTGLLRWRRGDTPSLGAFYNEFIKGQYPIRHGFYQPHGEGYTP